MVTIELNDGTRLTCEIREDAADVVRADFNPSGNPHVTAIKALAAALISEVAREAEETGDLHSLTLSREYAEIAAMFGVKCATAAPLPSAEDVALRRNGVREPK